VAYRRVLAAFAAALVLLLGGAQAWSDSGKGKTLSIEEIAAGLPAAPIVAGFDVDDTVLFASPGYYYGATNTDGPDGTNVYGAKPFAGQAFWDDRNARLDAFSLPLETGRKLIEMHKRRGDAIVFITARRGSEGETLTGRLNRIFGLSNEYPVIFTGGASKSPFMREKDVFIFYGDADGDMKNATDAGVRAVRVPRPAVSNDPRPTHPGAYGEEMLLAPWLE